MISCFQIGVAAGLATILGVSDPMILPVTDTVPLQVESYGLTDWCAMLIETTRLLGMCIVALVGTFVEVIVAATLAITSSVIAAPVTVYSQLETATSAWVMMFLSIWAATPSLVKSVLGG